MFSQEKNELVIEGESSDNSLVVCCRGGESTLFLHPGFTRARANVADIMPSTWGSVIGQISMDPSDRIITIPLGPTLRLLIQMFGTQSNVLLVDENFRIENAFRGPKAHIGQTIVRRQKDLSKNLADLRRHLASETTGTIHQALRRCFPPLGATVAREILFRANIAETLRPAEVRGATLDTLATSLSNTLGLMNDPSPRIYQTKSNVPALFSIIELLHVKNLDVHPFPDIHDALRSFVYRRRASTALETEKEALLAKVNQTVKRIHRAIGAIAAEKERAHRSLQYERYGKLILFHLHTIPPGAEEVELEDHSGLYRIPLDPGLPISHTAQRYFEKAKRSRQTERESAKRLQQLQERARNGEHLIALLHTISTKDQLRRSMDDHREQYEQFGVGPKNRAREEIPFRIFHVDGGFEVWAGKNSANNDLLTLRHAKPNDLWFHARGSGGSHVVLRIASAGGEPGKKAKHQAAGIAAYYSKMRKAKHVPVTMTRRKYVRKPKGAPPGTVRLEREELIFAEPVLPSSEGRT
jgi:predicted ribosome quality control (RQC) complex YloA/Tae2 family protein